MREIQKLPQTHVSLALFMEQRKEENARANEPDSNERKKGENSHALNEFMLSKLVNNSRAN